MILVPPENSSAAAGLLPKRQLQMLFCVWSDFHTSFQGIRKTGGRISIFLFSTNLTEVFTKNCKYTSFAPRNKTRLILVHEEKKNRWTSKKCQLWVLQGATESTEMPWHHLLGTLFPFLRGLSERGVYIITILWAPWAGGTHANGEIKWLLCFSVSSAHSPGHESKRDYLQMRGCRCLAFRGHPPGFRPEVILNKTLMWEQNHDSMML